MGWNRYKQVMIAVGAVLILIIATTFMGYLRGIADDIGMVVGEQSGKAVGTAIGSAKGITIGLQEGGKAGAEAGINAHDIKAEIKGTIQAMGKLEVMAASVSLQNVNTIGDTYAGLYLISGDAIFTIDLNKAQIDFNQDETEVTITVPQPDLNIYLNQNNTKKLAEFQKFSLTVSAEDGLQDYLNMMTETVQATKAKMSNYDALVSQANESAKNQVEQIAATICGNRYAVHVQIQQEGAGNDAK